MKKIFTPLRLLTMAIMAFGLPAAACSPMNPPTLVAQSVSGGNLILDWAGTTVWTCTYNVQVEIACNSSAFTGTGPFYDTPTIWSNGYWYPYPTQYISITSLCPGTTYKFRAREAFYTGTFSAWTSTFIFTTPGIYVPPAFSVSATPTSFCYPGSSQLNSVLGSACGPGTVHYSWSPATGLSNPFIPNPVASPSATTTYTCTAYGGGLSCWSVTDSVTINVVYPVNAGTAGISSDSMCSGTPAVLTLTGYSGSIQWESATGSSGPWSAMPGAITSTWTSAPLSSNTCFRAMVTGCTSAASSPVCATVLPDPTVAVNSVNICTGQPATLTASGAGSYSWSTGAAAASITVTPASTSSYTVTGISLGCTGTAVSTVTVTPYPVVTVNSATICPGTEAELTAAGASDYEWSNGAVCNPLLASPLLPSTYTVTGSTMGCAGTATATVSLYPALHANFNCPLSAEILHPDIQFTDLSVNAVSWEWDFGEPAAGPGNHSDLLNPGHSYSEAGNYCPALTITSPEGCTNTMVRCIEIEPLVTLYIPNSFTPDGDHLNDEFMAKGDGISSFSMSIFDRWGNLMFHSEDINDSWDGRKQRGKEICTADVYVYTVEVRDVKGRQHFYKGPVTVIR
jgi:gliding motility-associated-like protein